VNLLQELELLRLKTPRLYNINVGSENSDYCTHSDKNKDCYLFFAANFNRDCLYGGIVIKSQDCVDCNECDTSELCYECIDIDECYNCNYSQDLKNCSDCSFCYDCGGCKNCFGCVGLRQKEYYFFNERLSKEDYEKCVREFDHTHAYAQLNALMEKTPRRATHIVQSENCTGEFISKAKNCVECFGLHEGQDCCYLQDCWRIKDSVDCCFGDGAELCYECFSFGLNTYNCNFCSYVRSSSECEYSELLFSCKNCFGCVGLQNKEFHILNTPYSKEEYFKKVAEIKAGMRAEGIYGEQLGTTYKYEDTAAMYWK